MLNIRKLIEDKSDGKCFLYKDVWVAITFYYGTRSRIEGMEVVLGLNNMSTSRTFRCSDFTDRLDYDILNKQLDDAIEDFKKRFISVEPYLSE